MPLRLDQFPDSCLERFATLADEPTRDRLALTSRRLNHAVFEARYQELSRDSARPTRFSDELLPTHAELAARGCVRPRYATILRCAERMFGADALPPDAPLCKFFRDAAAFEAARQTGATEVRVYPIAPARARDPSSRSASDDDEPQPPALRGFLRCEVPQWHGGTEERLGYFSGNWELHGFGVIREAGRVEAEGYFKHHRLQGRGFRQLTATRSVEGRFWQDRPHGRVRLVERDAYVFEGLAEFGTLAHGTLTWRDGRRYTGPFADSLPHGLGEVVDPADGRWWQTFAGGVAVGPRLPEPPEPPEPVPAARPAPAASRLIQA